MTTFDAFLLGAFLCAMGTIAVAGAVRILAQRVGARLERRRQEMAVHLAFVRLAAAMRANDARVSAKHDMPWVDRVREAQVGQIVTLGISIKKAAAA